MRWRCGLVVWTLGCQADEASPRPEVAPAPALIVVTLDTVRADHIGAYGYVLPTSPQLDQLAARSDRYTRAVSSAPWTLPSHASLFTGLDPSEHGAVSVDPEGEGEDAWAVSSDVPTMAEVLRADGWQTAAFVGNAGYLDARFGLDRGFDLYEKPTARGSEALVPLWQWLDEVRDPARPAFVFLNLMDAHRLYNLAPLPAWPRPDRAEPGLLDELMVQVTRKGQDPDPELRAAVVRQYDHGIANADAALGALVAGLQARGQMSSATLVVTSDHGEAFGEHGYVEHAFDLYQSQIAVPLVIHRPGQSRGRLVDTPVSSAHLPGLLAPEHPVLSALPVPEGVVSENRFARPRDVGWASRNNEERYLRVRQALITPSRKLIATEGSDEVEIYDLLADPGELSRLAEEPPDDLRARLPEVRRGGRLPVAPDDAQQAALEALGYVEAAPDEEPSRSPSP